MHVAPSNVVTSGNLYNRVFSVMPLTSTEHVALHPPHVAVIIAEPLPIVITVPSLTTTTSSLSELHISLSLVSTGTIVATSVCVTLPSSAKTVSLRVISVQGLGVNSSIHVFTYGRRAAT